MFKVTEILGLFVTATESNLTWLKHLVLVSTTLYLLTIVLPHLVGLRSQLRTNHHLNPSCWWHRQVPTPPPGRDAENTEELCGQCKFKWNKRFPRRCSCLPSPPSAWHPSPGAWALLFLLHTHTPSPTPWSLKYSLSGLIQSHRCQQAWVLQPACLISGLHTALLGHALLISGMGIDYKCIWCWEQNAWANTEWLLSSF